MGQTLLHCCRPTLRMPLTCLRTSRTQLSKSTIKYSWWYACYDQSNRTIRTRTSRIEWRYFRIWYVSYELHYVPTSTICTKRTVRDPEQSEKCPYMGDMFLDSGRRLYITVRFMRIPVRDACYVKTRMSYELHGWFRMPSIRIVSVHCVLVHMFGIAIRLVRLVRKRYLYGLDLNHYKRDLGH